MIIGVLSDTHGTLHPGAIHLFRSAAVELILHAGDVGNYGVIEELEAIAPVRAVRGNIDVGGKAEELADELHLSFGDVAVYVTHIGSKPEQWLGKLPAPRPDVAICGHSHIPLTAIEGGVLFLNPGAAGTRPRFGRPLTAALLSITDGVAEAEIVTL